MPSGAPRPHRPNITGNTGAGIPFRCDGPTSLPPSGTRTSKRHDGGAAGSLYRRMFHAQAALQRFFARFSFRLDHGGRPGAVDRNGAARLDRIGLRDRALYPAVGGGHLRLGNLSAGSDEPRHLARGRLTNEATAGRKPRQRQPKITTGVCSRSLMRAIASRDVADPGAARMFGPFVADFGSADRISAEGWRL